MGGQGLLQFERRDIFAAAYDDVLSAIDDQNIAIFVDGGHVAGMEPSSAQGLGGGFRLVPVAQHYTVAAGDNLANGLAIVGHVLVRGVHDANLHAGNGVAGARLVDEAFVTLPVQTDLHAGRG